MEDVVTMLMTVITNRDRSAGTALNLASGEPRTVHDIGETIRGLVGRGQLKWGALPYRFGEAMNFYASMDRWRSLFGSPPLTSFEDSLQATIKTYCT